MVFTESLICAIIAFNLCRDFPGGSLVVGTIINSNNKEGN